MEKFGQVPQQKLQCKKSVFMKFHVIFYAFFGIVCFCGCKSRVTSGGEDHCIGPGLRVGDAPQDRFLCVPGVVRLT